MDWTSIIVTLITSGAFTTIYFLGDRKTASVLENVSKTIEQWRGLVDEYKNESEALRQQLADKDVKIDQLYKSIGTLRDRGDKLSSKVAYLNAFRCRKIKCLDREPPFGSVKMEDVGNGNDQ